VGIEEKTKVYVVLYMGGSREYVGVGTESGVEVFGVEGYERRIGYSEWEWREWGLVGRFECRQDFNGVRNHNKGLEMIQFANRHTINQI
jgi:hypothetical protein